MLKLPTHQRNKGPCTGGETLLFAATGGHAKELGGQLPPSLYVKRGPALKTIH